MKSLVWEIALEQKYLTIRYCSEKNLIWNEWKGQLTSNELRESIKYACSFRMSNDIELILADYILMGAPSMEDQTWIANYSAKILQYSKLKKVANLLASDIFQQIAIEVIYETASELPLPCESKYFLSQEDAMDWLLQD